LIGQIETITQRQATVFQARKLIQQENASDTFGEILDADVLLIVFPMYVDSLPAPLVKVLSRIEQAAAVFKHRVDVPVKPAPKVFAICNCGFYESEQTHLALRMIEHFAIRAGFTWGYGIGIGCGGFLLSQTKGLAKGPAVNVYAALCELSNAMLTDEVNRENLFVTPKIPRSLYKLGGNMGWAQMAKKYGTRNALQAKPHII